MGEVPVLEHGAKRLEPDRRDPALPRRPFPEVYGEDRQEVLRWILGDNHKLTSYIATLRFLVHSRRPARRR